MAAQISLRRIGLEGGDRPFELGQLTITRRSSNCSSPTVHAGCPLDVLFVTVYLHPGGTHRTASTTVPFGFLIELRQATNVWIFVICGGGFWALTTGAPAHRITPRSMHCQCPQRIVFDNLFVS